MVWCRPRYLTEAIAWIQIVFNGAGAILCSVSIFLNEFHSKLTTGTEVQDAVNRTDSNIIEEFYTNFMQLEDPWIYVVYGVALSVFTLSTVFGFVLIRGIYGRSVTCCDLWIIYMIVCTVVEMSVLFGLLLQTRKWIPMVSIPLVLNGACVVVVVLFVAEIERGGDVGRHEDFGPVLSRISIHSGIV